MSKSLQSRSISQGNKNATNALLFNCPLSTALPIILVLRCYHNIFHYLTSSPNKYNASPHSGEQGDIWKIW